MVYWTTPSSMASRAHITWPLIFYGENSAKNHTFQKIVSVHLGTSLVFLQDIPLGVGIKMQVQLFGQCWSSGCNSRSKLGHFEYSTPISAEIPKLIIWNDPKSAKNWPKIFFRNRINSHPDTLNAPLWVFFLNSLVQFLTSVMLPISYRSTVNWLLNFENCFILSERIGEI